MALPPPICLDSSSLLGALGLDDAVRRQQLAKALNEILSQELLLGDPANSATWGEALLTALSQRDVSDALRKTLSATEQRRPDPVTTLLSGLAERLDATQLDTTTTSATSIAEALTDEAEKRRQLAASVLWTAYICGATSVEEVHASLERRPALTAYFSRASMASVKDALEFIIKGEEQVAPEKWEHLANVAMQRAADAREAVRREAVRHREVQRLENERLEAERRAAEEREAVRREAARIEMERRENRRRAVEAVLPLVSAEPTAVADCIERLDDDTVRHLLVQAEAATAARNELEALTRDLHDAVAHKRFVEMTDLSSAAAAADTRVTTLRVEIDELLALGESTATASSASGQVVSDLPSATERVATRAIESPEPTTARLSAPAHEEPLPSAVVGGGDDAPLRVEASVVDDIWDDSSPVAKSASIETQSPEAPQPPVVADHRPAADEAVVDTPESALSSTRSLAEVAGKPAVETDDTKQISEHVWEALRKNRLGIALALLEPHRPESAEWELLASSIEMVAFAAVTNGSGDIDDQARVQMELVQGAWHEADGSPAVKTCASILLTPATILLALLAPGCNPSGLLSAQLHADADSGALPADVGSLREMAEALERTWSAVGGQLRPGERVAVDLINRDDWRDEALAHVERTRAWLDSHSARQVLFAAATDTWHAMIRADGVFGRHLFHTIVGSTGQSIESGSRTGVEAARSFLKSLDIVREIRKAELDVRGTPAARTRPIDARALRELKRLCEEAAEYIRVWVALMDRAPTRAADIQTRAAAELRAALNGFLPGALSELEALTTMAERGPAVGGAASAARHILGRLSEVLKGHTPRRSAPTVVSLLGMDLLPLLSVRFDKEFQRRPAASGRLDLALLTELLHSEEGTWNPITVVKKRLVEGHLREAYLALDIASQLPGDLTEVEKPIIDFTNKAKRNAVNGLLADRANVEDAERTGQMGAGDTENLIARIETIRSQIDNAKAPDLAECLDDVAQLRADVATRLKEARDQVSRRIRLRLDNLPRPIEDTVRQRIVRAIELGRFAIAEDGLERIEDGLDVEQEIAPPPVQASFDAFFPARAEALAAWLRDGGRGIDRLIANLVSNKPLPTEFRPERRAEVVGPAIKLLDAWKKCSAPRAVEFENSLADTISALGFTEPKLDNFKQPASSATEFSCRVSVRPLRERETAVLPEFGSVAGGHYRILCLWQKRGVEEIAEAFGRSPQGGATLILFFGILDTGRRRQLAAQAHRLRNALVIDDVLVAYLALLSGARLPNLLACTLPFTEARPWTDTGTPHPEMFFGRRREIQAIEAMTGEYTQLVYGGRQLGKTALLRQVERGAAESKDTVARYLSIAQIGSTRPVDDLWHEMIDILGTRISMERPRRDQSAANSFRKQVIDWLDGNASRRILLLLDEADAFFAADRRRMFAVTEALRTLSVITERRFKPVFAGLHNVQKLARDPNSPLAHLGQPVVVGPLIRGRERSEAEALVRWPFSALGYRMDDAIVTRILSFANYYPSLIQVVCQRLLRSLRERAGGGGPPWQVSIEDVEKVLSDKEIREAAFFRFRITLELDARYHLLALVTALLSMDDPELLARGIDMHTLRGMAAGEWPKGFPHDLSDDAFAALLDEMEGLGLLRQTDGTSYALRSHNLVHLIGTSAVITSQIKTISGRPGPIEPDPLQYRRLVKRRASLLTALQEDKILDRHGVVAILCGIAAAGVERWQESILEAVEFAKKQRSLELRVISTTATATFEGFQRTLARLNQGTDRESELLLISPEHPWDNTWIEEASRSLAVRPQLRRFARVLFVANAAKAWQWTADAESRNRLLSRQDGTAVTELNAGPWSQDALTLWLDVDDRAAQIPDWLNVDRVALLKGTGGWETRLYQLWAQKTKPGKMSADELAAELQAESSIGGDPFADIAKLDSVPTVLHALLEAEAARLPSEMIDAAMVAQLIPDWPPDVVAHVLRWAEVVGIATTGGEGLVLNSLVRAALPRLIGKTQEA